MSRTSKTTSGEKKKYKNPYWLQFFYITDQAYTCIKLIFITKTVGKIKKKLIKN